MSTKADPFKNLAENLIDNGVDIAFGIPGSGFLLDFLTYFTSGGGKVILCKNEATAAIMAGTVGKRDNKSYLAFCANGTARINLLSGIVHCYFEKLPVICLWDSDSHDLSPNQKLQRLPNHQFNPFYNEIFEDITDNPKSLVIHALNASKSPNFGPVGINMRHPK